MTSQITDSDTRHPGNGGGIEARRELWTKAGPVVSALPPQEVLALQERAEATVGEPGAMGLFGFAVGTLLIAIPITGWLPQQAISAALPAVLVFAGIAQFIAGLVAFRKGPPSPAPRSAAPTGSCSASNSSASPTSRWSWPLPRRR